MPIYEYQCQECGHQFDKLQKISDESLIECPSCNEPGLKKLISAPSFKLSGTGWYETDFKTKKVDTAKTEKKSEKSTASTSES